MLYFYNQSNKLFIDSPGPVVQLIYTKPQLQQSTSTVKPRTSNTCLVPTLLPSTKFKFIVINLCSSNTCRYRTLLSCLDPSLVANKAYTLYFTSTKIVCTVVHTIFEHILCTLYVQKAVRYICNQSTVVDSTVEYANCMPNKFFYLQNKTYNIEYSYRLDSKHNNTVHLYALLSMHSTYILVNVI